MMQLMPWYCVLTVEETVRALHMRNTSKRELVGVAGQIKPDIK
jgi:hypothetical protein